MSERASLQAWTILVFVQLPSFLPSKVCLSPHRHMAARYRKRVKTGGARNDSSSRVVVEESLLLIQYIVAARHRTSI